MELKRDRAIEKLDSVYCSQCGTVLEIVHPNHRETRLAEVRPVPGAADTNEEATTRLRYPVKISGRAKCPNCETLFRRDWCVGEEASHWEAVTTDEYECDYYHDGVAQNWPS